MPTGYQLHKRLWTTSCRAAGVVGGASLPWGLPSRHLALSPMSEAEDHEVTTGGHDVQAFMLLLQWLFLLRHRAVIQAVAWFGVLI